MWQKGDVHFAELLSRIRTGVITIDATEVLKSIIISPDNINYSLDDKHNKKMVTSLNTPLSSSCCWCQKKLRTGNANLTIPDNLSETGGLREIVSLCEGCWFMITKNICVEDSLVNGSIDLLLAFFCKRQPHSLTVAIFKKVWQLICGKVTKEEIILYLIFQRWKPHHHSWSNIFS